jgi:hypothetical protein
MEGLSFNRGMKQRVPSTDAASAVRWARRLLTRVEKVLAMNPDADPDNVRHTLILLELPPLERLQRSLIRGRAQKEFRSSVKSERRSPARWVSP